MKLLRKVRREILSFVLIIFFIGFSAVLENQKDSQSRILDYVRGVDKRDIQKMLEKPKRPLVYSPAAHNHLFLIPPYKMRVNDTSSYCLASFPTDPLLNNPCFDGFCIQTFDVTEYVGYTIGRGVGYGTGYATGELFIVPSLCLTMNSLNYPFLDLRGHYLDDGNVAANVGLGWRSYSCFFNRTVGLNIYYDYREYNDKSFNQISAGVEFLDSCFDFRFNGYLTLGNRSRVLDQELFTYPGGYWMQCKEYAASFQGFDCEIGRNLLCCCDFTLYGAIGPYFFDKEYCWSAFGGKARLEGRWCNTYSMDLIVSADSFFGDRVQLEILIPISSPCRCRCCPSVLPPRRFDIIPVEEICSWDWNFKDN